MTGSAATLSHVSVMPGEVIAALALLPVTVPGADDDAQCAPLLAQATQPVKAGRAGKPESSQTSNQLAEHPTR